MRRPLLLAALVLGFGVMFALWPRGQVQSWMLGWWAPVAGVLHTPARLWHALSVWLSRQAELAARVRELEEENARARLLAVELASVRTQLQALQALVGSMRAVPRWHAVRVVGALPGKVSTRLLVAGQASPDDAVLAAQGLVGLVDEVRGRYAVVRTILDASLAVPATDASRRLVLLVRGTGSRLVVRFAPLDARLHPGDVLYTSGAGGVFPPGVPVARITHVRAPEESLFLEIEAKPVARWATMPYLAVAPRQ